VLSFVINWISLNLNLIGHLKNLLFGFRNSYIYIIILYFNLIIWIIKIFIALSPLGDYLIDCKIKIADEET
jgi:hypothetical protein